MTDRDRGWRDATPLDARSQAANPRWRSSQQLRLSSHELRFDAPVHFIDITLGIDDRKSRRLSDGEREIAFAYSLMKPQLFRLEPPFVMHRLGVARPGAIEPEVLRQIEEEGQVRRERIRCPGVERAQFVEIDEPPESLIG